MRDSPGGGESGGRAAKGSRLDESRIFAQFEINVHNAKIANIAERVEDFFYLTNADNQPITDPEVCEQLTSEICKELDQHMQ